jgi:hypothetical protein
MIAEGNFNKLLVAIGRIGPDNEKMDMIKKLIDRNGKTETQWISIISTTEYMNADNEKSNLLIQVAKKMPEGERIKTAYLEMAKTIQADADYGRALRAVE